MEEAIGILFSGSIGAVIGGFATVYYQEYKSRKQEQRSIFKRLLAAKGYTNIPQFIVDDLNTIEVIFIGKKRVIEKYHEYYKELHVLPEQADFHRQRALYWDLLKAIGEVVGYRNLDNKLLQGYYIPNEHMGNYLQSKDFFEAQMKFFQTSASYHEKMLDLPSNQDKKKKKKGKKRVKQ